MKYNVQLSQSQRRNARALSSCDSRLLTPRSQHACSRWPVGLTPSQLVQIFAPAYRHFRFHSTNAFSYHYQHCSSVIFQLAKICSTPNEIWSCDIIEQLRHYKTSGVLKNFGSPWIRQRSLFCQILKCLWFAWTL